MNIILNGQNFTTAAGITVAELLAQLKLSGPVAVEVNKALCPRKTHDQAILNDGDIVEVVTAVGGG